LLIVMDGDYGSLTYAHPDDVELGREMDKALVSSVFAQPNAIRDLYVSTCSSLGFLTAELELV